MENMENKENIKNKENIEEDMEENMTEKIDKLQQDLEIMRSRLKGLSKTMKMFNQREEREKERDYLLSLVYKDKKALRFNNIFELLEELEENSMKRTKIHKHYV